MKVKGKQRFTTLLCALALLCALLPIRAVSTASAPTVYLLALNDKFCDLPGGLLPLNFNGTLYVPYTVFDTAVTGVDLGVYYGLGQDKGPVLSLYSNTNHLIFKVSKGLCLDQQNNKMDFNAIVRFGTIYVPLNEVCSFFGLGYAVMPTTDRGVLVRISNYNATLTDSQFFSYAAQGMSYRYNSIVKSQQPAATPEPQPTAANTEAPAASVPPDRSQVRIYLAIDGSQAEPMLLYDLSASLPGILFLFTPDSLITQNELVRQAVSAGHSVGLIVDGGTLEEVLGQLERGNELLRHIARIHTRIVSAPQALEETLAARGWSCWRADVEAVTLNGILSELEQKRERGRVTLPPAAPLIHSLLEELRESGYILRQPLETEL